MLKTLKSLTLQNAAMRQSDNERDVSAVLRGRDGRDPKLNLQWLAGLLAALAVIGGCVAQQHLSRVSHQEKRLALNTASLPPAAHTPARRRFQERLQTGYLDLALAAYERRAFAIADFFARRSIEAGGVAPLEPIAPDFDAPIEAASARRSLVVRLKKGEAERQPDTAAVAQLAVDCWLRESRSDGALDVRAGCRRQAEEALAALSGEKPAQNFSAASGPQRTALETKRASEALAALVEHWGPALERSRETAAALAAPVAATLRRRAASANPERVEAAESEEISAIADDAPMHHEDGKGAGPAPNASPTPGGAKPAEQAAGEPLALDGFLFGSAQPSALARRMIDAEARGGAAAHAQRVLIEGYADSAGAKSFNLALSRRRAEAVRDALAEALGAKTPPIEIRAYGETRLAVETGDGVPDPRNRRVVIRFN